MALEEGKIRFGIMGCAAIAGKVSRAISLAPNAVIVAVASRTAEKAARFAAENAGVPADARTYGSYEELLEDPEVDAVYLPLPTSMHVRWAVAVAEKGKHLLMEKPTAPCTVDLDLILAACDAAGVQFMDGTMWMHHPRTARMKELLADPSAFGQLRTVTSTFFTPGTPDFLKNNIRVKPDLDGLGSLGDLGWYCIRAILWAADYRMPKTAIALPNTVVNDAGVILSCGAALTWGDDTGNLAATFHCSFIANLTMDLSIYGSNGSLRFHDFVIPSQESSAGFTFASGTGFTDENHTRWHPVPGERAVENDLPQEALMVKEFSRLVAGIKSSGAKPESSWPAISRKTQLVMDAVKASVDKGFVPVDVGN